MLSEDVVARMIRDFHEEAAKDPLYDREAELPTELKLSRAISVIGPRRSGKSYLLLLVIRKLLGNGIDKSRMLKINFEDIAFSNATASDLDTLPNTYFRIYPGNAGKEIWLFLDEVQEINGWERWVRSLLDRGIYKVYISGSSSKLLSKEIATQMRGRTLGHMTYTLSFREFLQFTNTKYSQYMSTAERAAVIRSADEYVRYGGYPEAALMPGEREKILREIMEVTISKDIVERHKVRNPKIIRVLINALANSQEFSANKFTDFLKSQGYRVSKNTIYAYMQALGDAFIVYYVRNFSKSYKAREQSMPKPFFADNGLLAVNGVTDNSRFMENAVFVELLRRHGEGKVFYAKGQSYDIDFVVAGRKAGQLIQVSHSIDNFATRDREFRALFNASERLDCDDLLLITWETEEQHRYNRKTIKCIPLWKWLLQKPMQNSKS
ncbi:MAG: ATP-binding protein [Candidatus Marsarchaeota archaeon]|nr:ATP-binding protein [Candidatus Marsarchaeota archaeon]